MTKLERKAAEVVLRQFCDRIEHVRDGDSYGIAAHWLDGGQPIFWSLEQVNQYFDRTVV